MKEPDFIKEARERNERKKIVAQQLMGTAVELRLTWAEFEEAIDLIKKTAYISDVSAGTTS